MGNYEAREQRQAKRDRNPSLNSIKLQEGYWTFSFSSFLFWLSKGVRGGKASKSVPHVGKIQPLANVT